MSDQNTGGGGSVVWSVDADDVNPAEAECRDQGGGKHHQHGRDKSAGAGDWFTVSIEVPEGISLNDYLGFLKGNDPMLGLKEDPKGHGRRVSFNLRIEHENHDQIRISWGNSDNMNLSRATTT